MEINVPVYSKQGIEFIWENGFTIKCSINAKENFVCIEANSAGLVSLARHLLVLAQDAVPNNGHFHLDEYNSLEDGSTELIVIRKTD